MKRLTWILCLTAVTVGICEKQASADDNDKETVLPGRHLSEHQVADIANAQLPQTARFSCEYTDGVWDVLEPQAGVWGVASVTTNVEGRVFVNSTNATTLVLRVRDADGKVESLKTP